MHVTFPLSILFPCYNPISSSLLSSPLASYIVLEPMLLPLMKNYILVKMNKDPPHSKLIFIWASVTFAFLLNQGCTGEKCERNGPTVEQTQVGFGRPPKYMVQVVNNCAMCPIINVHLQCGSFPQASVNPKLLKVLGHNDCVVNGGFPLSPLEIFAFNYSTHKYQMQPLTWYFQCE